MTSETKCLRGNTKALEHVTHWRTRKLLKGRNASNAIKSDPVGIQTQDLQNRNLTLYSAKLRDHDCFTRAKVEKKNELNE